MFACGGLDWLKPNGILAYIATNNWVTNSGAKKLREKISLEARIEQLIDFGDFKVFRDAGIQTMILVARKDTTSASYNFDYRRLTGGKRSLSDIQGLLEKSPGAGREFLAPLMDRGRTPSAPLTFSSGDIEVVLDKMFGKKNFLLNKNEVGVGIDVHQDFVNSSAKKILGPEFSIGQGIFNLSDEEKRALKLTKAESALIKPFYTSYELGKYAGSPNNRLWVIYTNSAFKNPLEMEAYPALKKHLDQFKKVITSDNYPYGLHRARTENLFVGEKIISLRKCNQ